MPKDQVAQEASSTEAFRAPYALLCELEGVAVDARHAEYEALCSLLAEQKVDLPASLFARHCLNLAPSVYLPRLAEALESRKSFPERLADDIKDGVALFLSSAEATLRPMVADFFKSARNRDMEVVLLTSAKESIARTLTERWGEGNPHTRLFSFEPGTHPSPRADVWLKMAKSLSLAPRQCVALVGSNCSAKAALCAGMRCIAIPDEFTSFHDFSGVDAVLDDSEPINAAHWLDLVAPSKPLF